MNKDENFILKDENYFLRELIKTYYEPKIKELEKFNYDIVEKYLKKIHSIIDKYDEDSELLHIELDDLLLDFIDELGYHQIVASYLSKKDRFWYA